MNVELLFVRCILQVIRDHNDVGVSNSASFKVHVLFLTSAKYLRLEVLESFPPHSQLAKASLHLCRFPGNMPVLQDIIELMTLRDRSHR